jgi:hypothetical protein
MSEALGVIPSTTYTQIRGKITTAKVGDVDHWQCVLSMHEALGLIPSTTFKKEKKRKENRGSCL